MNEMNELEKQLRSWTPRRPSAEIESRLWPAPRRAPRSFRPVAWLAPATVCFLFACLVLNQHGGGTFTEGGRSGSLVGLILSNQSYAAYLPGGYQPANNRLDTFEWTNPVQNTSPMPFISSPRAND